jgi:hypothetical protein
VAVGPFEADGFGVGQFHRRRFDGHFENFFGHKIFNAREKLLNFWNASKICRAKQVTKRENYLSAGFLISLSA